MGNQERVSVTYKNLINNLKVGDHVLINNGLIILEVEKLKAPDAICKVLVGGEVSDKKSMNFPNKVMDHAFLSEQDKKDLLFGIKNDVDFVAASFVSVKKDVEDVTYIMCRWEMNSTAWVSWKYLTPVWLSSQ